MESLPYDWILEQIEPLCERFEADLAAGRAPSIETVVDGAKLEGKMRSTLVQELVALEVFFSRKSGEDPDLEEYLDRFSIDRSAVRAAFSSTGATAPVAALSLEKGAVLGPYTVVREIGRGGMGIVYEARHSQLDRAVALKLLSTQAHGNPQAEERFLREARAIAKLHHGSIVPVFDYGKLDGRRYFAMQLIDGESMGEAIQRHMAHGARSLERGTMRLVIQQIVQIARALDFAHNRGVVHRDVKPSNILIDHLGAAWLVDFGVAHTQESDLTTQDDLLGTMRYMPPERFEGRTGATDDVYSLGMTLFEALTLQPVFAETDPVLLMRSIVDWRAPRLADVWPAAPRDLDTVIGVAMAEEPSKRYASPGAFADDLERFLANVPVAARRAGPLERVWRWGKRNPAGALAIVALSLLAGGGGSLAWVLSRRNTKITELSSSVGTLLVESEEARAGMRFEVYRSDMQLGAQAVFRNRGAAIDDRLGRWLPQGGEADLRGWEWHALRSMTARAEDCTWHERGVGRSLHAAAGYLATSGGNAVSLFDRASSERLLWIDALGHPMDARIDPTGAWLLVTAENRVIAFDVATGDRVGVHDGTRYRGAEWTHTTGVAAVLDPWPSLWDVVTGTVTRLEELEGLGEDFDVSANGRWVAATDGGSVVRVLDVTTLEVVGEIRPESTRHGLFYHVIEVSPSAGFVAGGNEMGEVTVWNAASGGVAARFDAAHLARVTSLRWSSDGERLISCSEDSTVKVWNVKSGQCERVLRGHLGIVRDAIFVEDDRRIISTSDVGDERSWDLSERPGHTYLEGPNRFPSPDIRRAVWSADDSRLRIVGQRVTTEWDMASAVPREVDRVTRMWPFPSPDGALELRVFSDHLELIDLVSGTNLFEGRTEKPIVQSLDERLGFSFSWSPDARSIYVSNSGRGFAIQDLRGDLRVEPLSPGPPLLHLQACPDARHVIAVWDRCYVVIDTEVPEVVAQIDPLPMGKKTFDDGWMAFRPGGSELALSAGVEVYLVDAETWKIRKTLGSATDTVIDLAWSPDGERLAVSTLDGAVRLFHPSEGLVVSFPTDIPVRNLAWSHGGERLVGVDDAGGWHLWDASASLAAGMGAEQLGDLPPGTLGDGR